MLMMVRGHGSRLVALWKNAACMWPIRVLTWPVRENTVVPLRANYGLGPVVITTL